MRMICVACAAYAGFYAWSQTGIRQGFGIVICIVAICNSVYFSVREAIRDEKEKQP